MKREFNGLGMHLGNLSRLSSAKTRSISAENANGAKGAGGMATEGISAFAARELGQGWKINPCIAIEAHATATLAEIDGPGAIQHMWMTTFPKYWRSLILRFYWDNEETPSVEVPLGDFFCNGWGVHSYVDSQPIAVNPAGAFNSYWEMPFRKHARVTIENISPDRCELFFFQIDYTLTDIPEDCAYFHAQWRRSNPVPYKEVHTLLDGVKGEGQYIGTYIAWGSNNNGWWGEGEIKFYMDGDTDWPTICGTGTEDYFGGAWCFVEDLNAEPKEYKTYTTSFLGFHQLIKPDGAWKSQTRFGLYRWHVMDPIRFESDLRVTIQALGWRSTLEGKMRYLALQDDIASTSFWYQTEPHAPFPPTPTMNDYEVI